MYITDFNYLACNLNSTHTHKDCELQPVFTDFQSKRHNQKKSYLEISSLLFCLKEKQNKTNLLFNDSIVIKQNDT